MHQRIGFKSVPEVLISAKRQIDLCTCNFQSNKIELLFPFSSILLCLMLKINTVY